MELPVEKTGTARDATDVLRMAIVVQANVVQLKIADCKRRGIDRAAHDIKIESPGHVAHSREHLIDHRRIREYSDLELQLRLREVWGQLCLMRWLFAAVDPRQPFSFSAMPPDARLGCDTSLSVKLAEIHATLWRLKFEQASRHDPAFTAAPAFEKRRELADTIPAAVAGQPVVEATDQALLECACEHVGMLAALRWVCDPKAAWGDEALMQVKPDPF